MAGGGTKFSLLVALKTTGQAGLKRLGNSMQGLQGRMKNLRASVLSLNTAFKAFAAVMAARTMSRFVKGAIDQADAFGKLSRQTGIAASELQSYVNAGKLAGVEQANIEKGLRRLSQSMYEADQGVATYADAYNALGLTVRTSEGNLKDSEVVLGEIADRFANMPDGATKAALAMEIFGRSGAQMIPMLNEGSEALNQWNYETSEGFAQNAEYFNDQITMLKIGFDGFRKQLADAVLPALNSIMEVFRDMFGSQNDWSGFFKFIEGSIRGIAITVFGVAKLFQEIGKLGTVIINRIRTLMEEIDKRTPGWIKKLMGGGVKNLKTLGSRFIAQQETNARNLLGDDYVDDAKDRFKTNLPQLQKIAGGEAETPESYFKKGTKEAKLLDAQIKNMGGSIEKTFGQSFKEKMTSFKDSISDVGSQVADVAIKAFKGLEDQIVSLVMNGKMSFKELTRSIIADMARIAIRAMIIKPIMAGFGFAKGGAFNQGGQIHEYAKGGVFHSPHMFAMGGSGQLGILGEKGPEAVLPLRRGANGKLGVESNGSGSTVVNVAVDAKGTQVQGSEEEGRMLGQLIANACKGIIIQEKRPGGLLAA
jgi:predicted DNA-binding ArsR family transcriptional regulator